MYRSGGNLNEFAVGLGDLFRGDDSVEAEAAAMVLGEAMAIYIKQATSKR